MWPKWKIEQEMERTAATEKTSDAAGLAVEVELETSDAVQTASD